MHMPSPVSRLLKQALLPSILVAAGVVQAAGSSTAPVTAAQPVPDRKSMPAASATTKYHATRASKLIGTKVHSADDKSLGKIKDLIVDMGSGDIRYAVLQFDPGIFKGDKVFAMPLRDLQTTPGKDGLLYANMSRERLEKAAVERTDWTRALSNRQFLEGVDRAYGLEPPAEGARSLPASKLIGKHIKSREGKGIGKIKELVVDTSASKVAYAVLGFDPSFFSGTKLFAFSLASFTRAEDKDDLVLNVDKSKIQAMKDFKEERWAHLNDPDRAAYINTAPR
ncbi:MAG: PRC-barrel domain-containing protein [Gammaproteobacteria bacterium]|nr:PRC-barrel domain-containing protein [Gammaproteobacteria bacterium]